MVETVSAQPLPQATAASAAGRNLEPGSELKARVEANLPGGVVRLATGSSRVDLRIATPLPVGTDVTVSVDGTKAAPEIRISTQKPAEGSVPQQPQQSQQSQPSAVSRPPQQPPLQQPPQSASQSAQLPAASAGQTTAPLPAALSVQGAVFDADPALLQQGSSQAPDTSTQTQTQAKSAAAQVVRGGGATLPGAPPPGAGSQASSTAPAPGRAAPTAQQTVSAPLPSSAASTATSTATTPVPASQSAATAGQPVPQTGTGQTAAQANTVQSAPQATGNPTGPQPGAGQQAQPPLVQSVSSSPSSFAAAAAQTSAGGNAASGPTPTPGPITTSSAAPSAQISAAPQTPTGSNGPSAPAATVSAAQPSGGSAQPIQSGAALQGGAAAPVVSGQAPQQSTLSTGTAAVRGVQARPAMQPAQSALPGTAQPLQATQSPQGTNAPIGPQQAGAQGVQSTSATPIAAQSTPSTAGTQSAPSQHTASTNAAASASGAAASGQSAALQTSQGTLFRQSVPAQPYPSVTGPVSSAGEGAVTAQPQSPVSEAAKALQQPLGEQQAALGNLFTQMSGLLNAQGATKPDLPDAVTKAMQQILGLRLKPEGGLSGQDLQQATRLSGQFREAQLARGGQLPLPGSAQGLGGAPQALPDLKSALLSFKALLQGFGAQPQVQRPASQPATPSRQGSPAGQAPATGGGQGAAGQIAMTQAQLLQALLSDTDAALARVRLTQLVNSGLSSEDGPQATGRPMDLVLELPLATGQETAVLQMQVGRDGSGKEGEDEGEPAWRLRFALDLTATGPLEAAVSLRGGGTYASLWVERNATFESLNGARATMEAAFADAGLDLMELRLIRGLPPKTAARSGALVDRRS